MTPQVARFKDEVERLFGPEITSLGVTNCRRIAGSGAWSQHSWSNAWDVSTKWWRTRLIPGHRIKHNILLNDVVFWLEAHKERLRIRTVLWQVASHYDHIHVDFWPKGFDQPPCAGGSLKTRDRDGTIRDTFTVTAPMPSLEEPMNIEWTPERIRAAFNLPGVDGDPDYYITGDGRKGGADVDAWPNFLRKVDSGVLDRISGTGIPTHSHRVEGEAH